jgi:HSP20 family protein
VLKLGVHGVPPAEVAGGVYEEVRAVLRFDPFRDFDRMTEQLLGVPSGSARAPRFMPMDLYRSGDHYVLHADLPGIDPGSVDVNVENGTLTIKAERSSRTEQDVQWISSERFTGTFMRQLSLGEGVDTDGITATYANGVLTLTIPMAERAKARRIEVSAKREQTTIEAGQPQQTELKS